MQRPPKHGRKKRAEGGRRRERTNCHNNLDSDLKDMSALCACLSVCARVCVWWGKSSCSFLLSHKKGGSEVERTGTLHSAAPCKYWCVSAGPRPPAGASARSGQGDKDASMRQELTSSHLPRRAWRMPLQSCAWKP